jgi:hypothetical protein
MTDLHKAAQQALEALEEFGTHYEYCPRYPTWARPELQPPCNCGLDSNVVALRAALAQQTQTPCDIAEDGVCEVIDCCRNSTQQEQEPAVRFKCTVVDDQHPNGVPFEQWVNAPQQEAPKGGGNLPPPLQAAPVLVVEKEPDYMSRGHFYEGSKPFIDPTLVWKLPIGTKLYTAPPRREWQSLSEEESNELSHMMVKGHKSVNWLARAIEAKLKEKNHG